ncbi:hypothetical protein JXA32_11280 [Candidatus Sumerlaeota bacterium]|nr:hypothetical protein [Candidatus Sumerlaeota bacterium]
MSRNTIIYGALMIVIGLAGKFGTGTSSWTALIPAIFGVVFVVAGIVGAVHEKFRKHAMHLCMLLGILIIVGLVAMLTVNAGKIPSLEQIADGTAKSGKSMAMLSQLLVIILTTVYIQLGIQSFIAARVKRDKE